MLLNNCGIEQLEGCLKKNFLSLPIMRNIFFQNKNSKSGCTLYMRAELAKKIVFHNQMHHFLGYALAPEARKSKTKFYTDF